MSKSRDLGEFPAAALDIDASGNVSVDGAVTADGLTVDGDVNINTNTIVHTALTPSYNFIESDTIGENAQFLLASGTFRFRTVDDSGSNAVERMRIDHQTGDISFYEDTGTTPKFFWDASAESLGIGTSSPDLSDFTGAATGLHIKGLAPAIRLEDTSGENSIIAQLNENLYIINKAAGPIRLSTSSIERMRIDSSGNVGIGTTSPDEALEVSGDLKISGSGFGIVHFGDTSDVTKIVGRDGAHATAPNTMEFYTNSAERLRIDNAGNVGIGTTTPSSALDVNGTVTADGLTVGAGAYGTLLTAGGPNGYISVSNPSGNLVTAFTGTSDALALGTSNTERMRIAANGSVALGPNLTTTPNATSFLDIRGGRTIQIGKNSINNYYGSSIYMSVDAGSTEKAWNVGTRYVGTNSTALVFEASSNANAGRSGDVSGLNYVEAMRIDSAGHLLVGTTTAPPFGNVNFGGSFYANAAIGDEFSGIYFGISGVYPSVGGGLSDNQIDLGNASYRWDDVYATNGTIQTSDRNEKQDILEITAAETAVATACKGLLRSFRWKDSVAEKGDDARVHFGIIAQDLQDAFTAEGLDAGRYAMFISGTSWETQTEVAAVEAVDEVTDKDGNVTTEAVEAKDAYTRTDTFEALAEAPEGATERTRLGVRYSELLAFIIAAI